jgi:hypothetical protein
MGSKLTNGVVATLAMLLLTACSPTPTVSASPGSSGVTSAPAPTVTVTATVTVTPSPVAAPVPPDFDFTSFEGAKIGSNWAQMSTQIRLAVSGNYQCAWYGLLRGTEAMQTYAFTKASQPNSGSTFFYTQLEDLTTTGPFPHNAEGVGVGSTKAEVLAAYPGAVVGSVNDLGAGHITTITVPAPSGGSTYVFGISGNSRDPNTVDLLQWGSAAAGSQWSHLCTGF